MIRLRHPLLKNGLNLPIAVSSDVVLQNAYYNGWTCEHYCSSVFGCAPDGRMVYASLNAPGSWHAITRDLYANLLRRTPHGYYAIADTAFPRRQKNILGRIKTPLKKNDAHPMKLRIEGRQAEYEDLIAFHAKLPSGGCADSRNRLRDSRCLFPLTTTSIDLDYSKFDPVYINCARHR
jgi:hypothetical protein